MAKTDSYVIEREDDITRIDFKRSPTSEELYSLLEQLEQLEDSELRMFVMIEAEIMLSTAEVREGAQQARALARQPEKIAVVAPGDITYGISRIFKVFRESDRTDLQVFRDLDEARAWLRGENA